MTSFDIDTSELQAFAVHLRDAGRITARQTRGVVSKGALNIKNQLQAEMKRSRHFAVVAPAITYDLREVGAFGGGFVEAEIGPERGAPGSLANVAYFGTGRGGGNTVPDPEGALMAEAPNVESYLADLAERTV